MSVVGIDFGSSKSVIAVARNRGIDIIINEVSNRSTPSMVSFGTKNRYLGEAAKTQELSNYKNTVSNLTRIIGHAAGDPEIEQIESKFLTCKHTELNGRLAFEVNYGGEQKVFNDIQIVAMYLTQLKHTAEAALNSHVSDVVISVPPYFTEFQRRAVLDAAETAGLNCLRLMNTTTAAALAYGIPKSDLPEEKPRNVVFVDVGFSSTEVAVVSFMKGKLQVKSVSFDRHLGGRNFDELLVDHFCAQFKEKFKIDIKSNPKALLRLRVQIERMKKILSANSTTVLSVESIMNDIDVRGNYSRAELEDLVKPLLSKLHVTIEKALTEAGLTKEDIFAVEILGGVTRIPTVKETIHQSLGIETSTTLNQDEAVAKGCAFMCAMISPVFKVREFAVHDISPYPIKLLWEPKSADSTDEREMQIFSKYNSIPSAKAVTFYRREPFEVEAHYVHAPELPPSISTQLGRFVVTKVHPATDDKPCEVKLKVKLNGHGLLSIETAQVLEEAANGGEENPPTPMETDVDQKAENGGDQKPDEGEKKPKKKFIKKDVPVASTTPSLPRDLVGKYKEQELSMAATDKLVADTAEKKNALEEYIYDIRGKIDGPYATFVNDSDKANLLKRLEDTENWLYDEGEDATKSAYVSKLADLHVLGNPIASRYHEAEERPRTVKLLEDAIAHYRSESLSADEKYSHIDFGEKGKILTACEEREQWLKDVSAKQASLHSHQDPAFLCTAVRQQCDSLIAIGTAILSKPKPKPAAPAVPAANEPEKANTMEQDTPVDKEAVPNRDDMDIDN